MRFHCRLKFKAPAKEKKRGWAFLKKKNSNLQKNKLTMGKIKTGEEAKRFKMALDDMVAAFIEAEIPYQLSSGTALGAHRDKGFIEHDDDIDLQVFRKDVTRKKEILLKKCIRKHGFKKNIRSLGNFDEGYEIAGFHKKTDIRVDVFFIYDAVYQGKPIYYYASFFGKCDNLPKKMCVWRMRPYQVSTATIDGTQYVAPPISYIEDQYGPGWNVPIKYDYFEGLNLGHSKGLLEDFWTQEHSSKKHSSKKHSSKKHSSKKSH
jgi:hypothetical protein